MHDFRRLRVWQLARELGVGRGRSQAITPGTLHPTDRPVAIDSAHAGGPHAEPPM